MKEADDSVSGTVRYNEVLAYQGQQMLSLARATRACIQAEEQFISKQLEEAELVVNILREASEENQQRLLAATYQVAVVREELNSQGIMARPSLLPDMALLNAFACSSQLSSSASAASDVEGAEERNAHDEVSANVPQPAGLGSTSR